MLDTREHTGDYRHVIRSITTKRDRRGLTVMPNDMRKRKGAETLAYTTLMCDSK